MRVNKTSIKIITNGVTGLLEKIFVSLVDISKEKYLLSFFFSK